MPTSLLRTSLGSPALAEQIPVKPMIGNGAEGFQDDELHGSKEKKKAKANMDLLSENLQVMDEIQEKPSKKKKKKKTTDGDGVKTEEEISEKGDGSHEDGIAEKHKKKKKKKKKKSREAETEEKAEIAKQEEITGIRDLEIREKAPKKKKKKKRAEGNRIEATESLHEGIEDGTAKEEHNTEESHKKKKKKKEKRAEGNGIVKVENSEEGIEYGTVKEEEYTEKSPKKTKKNSNGEDCDNVEEKVKRKKKTEKSNEREGYDIVEFKEKRKKGNKSSEGEDYDNVEEKEKSTKKRKRGELVSDNTNRGESSPAERSPPNKKQKKVTFSDNVEVFLIEDKKNGEKIKDGEISIAASGDGSKQVWGKRFSKAEDQAIRNAVSAYIQEHGFEEEKGIHMILNSKKNSEVRNCWKEIAAALPWRPLMSVYLRAHILYERSEESGWTKDEINTLKRLQAEHGNNWKKIAEFLGKSRYHVKDKWRRIKRSGLNSGHWSQDEYQKLFDLVNQDLQLKSLQKDEKLSRNVLRDNINWEAIADKMGTRDHVYCCKKWYYSLASPMVQNGEWENADDITLLRSLLETNATDEEAVDWNVLVEGRSSVVCLNRWRQMVKHLGECYNKPFLEKLEMLAKRYIPDLVE